MMAFQFHSHLRNCALSGGLWMGLQLGELEMGDTFYFVRLSFFSLRIEAARVWKKQFPFGFL